MFDANTVPDLHEWDDDTSDSQDDAHIEVEFVFPLPPQHDGSHHAMTFSGGDTTNELMQNGFPAEVLQRNLPLTEIPGDPDNQKDMVAMAWFKMLMGRANNPVVERLDVDNHILANGWGDFL